jgi:hypothetical protein
MMIANYPATSSTILDLGTPRLTILANPTKKLLKINKDTRIGTIHEYVNTVYILTDITRALVILATTSNIGIEPLSPI